MANSKYTPLTLTWPKPTKGIDEFNEAVKKWEKQLGNMLVSIDSAQSIDGIPTTTRKVIQFIKEFNELINTTRNSINYLDYKATKKEDNHE